VVYHCYYLCLHIYSDIKPAKDAEERLRILETSFETIVKEKLEKYIENKEFNDMKTAISNLLSNDVELKTQAINYINYNPNVQIDDIERKKIYEILIDPNVSEQIRLPLYLVLSNKKSTWADLYFDRLATNEDDFKNGSFYIAKYLLLNGFKYKRNKIVSLLEKCEDKSSLLYYYIIYTSLTFSDSLLQEIINDKETLSIFSNDDIIKLYNLVKDAKNNQSIIEGSELHKLAKD
jgi:hypothetical protein